MYGVKDYNIKNIHDALQDCTVKPRYYVGICHPLIHVAEEDLKAEVEGTNYILSQVKCMRKSGGLLEIHFINGSHIKVIPMSSSARGRRYHELIIHRDVNDDIRNTVLRPYIIKYENYLDER